MNYQHLRIDATHQKWITVWLDARDRTLNVLFEEFFEELRAVFEVVKADPSQRPLVIRSGKEKGFVVGADIKRIINIHTDAEIQAFMKLGQDVFHELEQLPNVTIAWIAGACLGGGLELALACRHRIVLDAPETLLGMPESKLGLTPGWGGTHRLVRRVGLQHGLQMLMIGEPIGATLAIEYRLADGLWNRNEDVDQQIERWVQRLKDGPPRPSWNNHPSEWGTLAPQRIQWRTAGLTADQGWMEDARRATERAVEIGIMESAEQSERFEREGFFQLLNRPKVQSTLALFSAPKKR